MAKGRAKDINGNFAGQSKDFNNNRSINGKVKDSKSSTSRQFRDMSHPDK